MALTLFLTLTDTGGAVLTLSYTEVLYIISEHHKRVYIELRISVKNFYKKSFAGVRGSGWAKSTV